MKIARAINKNGFSLVELMVSVAIGGLLTLALIGLISFANQSQANVEKTADIANLTDEIQAALADRQRCTLNLQNTPISMDTPEGSASPNPSIRFFDSAGTAGATLLTRGAEVNGVTANRITVIPIAQLDATRYTALLSLEFQKSNVLGPQTATRNIPLVVITDAAGLLTSCSSSSASDLLLGERLCEIKGGGRLSFDPATGECVPKDFQWITGTSAAATCPAGSSIPPVGDQWDNCSYTWPDGFDDSGTTCVTITMADGSIHETCTPPVQNSLNAATNTCKCLYAQGVDPSQFQCQVRCQEWAP